MAKKVRLNKIKKRELYSTQSLADLLEVHQRTVQAWVKDGLTPIEDSKPMLFLGLDVYEFIKNKNEARKHKLADNEFYCMKCKKAVQSKNNEVMLVKTNIIGKNNNSEIHVIGSCCFCNNFIFKFSNMSKIKDLLKVFNVSNKEDYRGNCQ